MAVNPAVLLVQGPTFIYGNLTIPHPLANPPTSTQFCEAAMLSKNARHAKLTMAHQPGTPGYVSDDAFAACIAYEKVVIDLYAAQAAGVLPGLVSTRHHRNFGITNCIELINFQPITIKPRTPKEQCPKLGHSTKSYCQMDDVPGISLFQDRMALLSFLLSSILQQFRRLHIKCLLFTLPPQHSHRSNAPSAPSPAHPASNRAPIDMSSTTSVSIFKATSNFSYCSLRLSPATFSGRKFRASKYFWPALQGATVV
ncbi:hypothetical protein BDP27DRAFT_1441453 [Rhodocollybia butyracea]|uniref:Uncharacterized protein n=1 Tax=Rhodocollybia butyracea TaxID=206335 RepID=A0A9P5QAP2_9AGAR|nr:hypothetical protein BDP27DRAFT_1441453 [Rhodocollybia butyracea]